MDSISQIAPVTDAEAARMVSPATMTDLAEQITATASTPIAATPKRPMRRPAILAAPLAAGIAAAALIMIPSHAGPRHPPVSIGKPLTAEPLAFISGNGSITVIVRNPLADPSSYRAEFARHHLDIALRLIPVSPSLVGTLVYSGESPGATNLVPITAKGRCYSGGGGSECPVGVRIPAGFHGQAALVFGRAAKPGEQYESTASAFAHGEVLYGMQVTGKTVGQVIAALHLRHITAPVFHTYRNNYGILLHASQVPATWYVYDADPWAPDEVMLFVGPTVKQPQLRSPTRPSPTRPSKS